VPAASSQELQGRRNEQMNSIKKKGRKERKGRKKGSEGRKEGGSRKKENSPWITVKKL
jgi:hypothetical protein